MNERLTTVFVEQPLPSPGLANNYSHIFMNTNDSVYTFLYAKSCLN